MASDDQPPPVDASASDAAIGLRKWAGLEVHPKARALRDVISRLGARTASTDLHGASGRTTTPKHHRSQWLVETERGAPLTRMRFTMAHEMGHLLLRAAGEERKDEERWCDLFASELLMPHDWVRMRFYGTRPSLETARALADEAVVSLRAAIVRLSQVAGWRCSVVEFDRRPQGWVISEMANMPRVAVYRLGVTDELRTTLASPFREPEQQWLRFYFLGELIEISAEVVGTGRSRTALVEPTGVSRVCQEIARDAQHLRRDASTTCENWTSRLG